MFVYHAGIAPRRADARLIIWTIGASVGLSGAFEIHVFGHFFWRVLIKEKRIVALILNGRA